MSQKPFIPVRINIITSARNESYNGLRKYQDGVYVVALQFRNTGDGPLNFPGYFTLAAGQIRVIQIPSMTAFVGSFTWNVPTGTSVSLEITETYASDKI